MSICWTMLVMGGCQGRVVQRGLKTDYQLYPQICKGETYIIFYVLLCGILLLLKFINAFWSALIFLRAFVPYERGVTLGGWCVCSRGKVWTGLKSLFSPHLSLLLHIYVHLLDHAGNTEH